MTLRETLDTPATAPSAAEAVVWRSGSHWLGYWKDFPSYWTQGETPEELETMLTSLRVDLAEWSEHPGEEGPGIRRVVVIHLPVDEAPAEKAA
jgi:hypothetical protein